MDRINHLEQRLAVLEHEMHRCRRSAARSRMTASVLACAIIGGVALAAAAPRPDILQAQRLEIVDAQGRLVLAADGANANGGQLDFWTAEGRNVMRLSTNAHGGDIVVWNTEGSAVASAYATAAGSDLLMARADGTIALTALGGPDGGRLDLHAANGAAYCNIAGRSDFAAIVLRNNTGKPVVRLQSAPQGASAALLSETGEPMFLGRATAGGGEMLVSNAAGQRIVRAGGNGEEGRGVVEVLGDEGRRLAALATTEAGEGRLAIANKDGHDVLTAESVTDAGASITLTNHRGLRMFAIGTREAGGLLNIMNRSGVPIVMAGFAEDGQGGGLSIRNGRGIHVLNTGTGEGEHGVLTLWDADGRRARVFRPVNGP